MLRLARLGIETFGWDCWLPTAVTRSLKSTIPPPSWGGLACVCAFVTHTDRDPENATSFLHPVANVIRDFLDKGAFLGSPRLSLTKLTASNIAHHPPGKDN